MKHYYYSPSSWQGVRRISALLVCLLFTFVFVVSPIKVKAEAFPIPPVWLPMNPYNAQGLEGNYVLLNDDQKEIVKEIIGAVNVVNLGFGQYVLTNPVIGIPATRQFLREYGGTFLETFWTQIMGTSRAMTDFVGSTIYKASTYDTLEDYEADTSPTVASGSQKYFQISPELTVAFKNWYRANGGVEDWQLQVKPFKSTVPYRIFNMSGTYQTQYNNYVSTFSEPKVRFNYLYFTQGYDGNGLCSSDIFSTYTNMFIKVNNGSAFLYFADDNGNMIENMATQSIKWIYSYKEFNRENLASGSNRYFSYPKGLGNISGYASYVELVQAIYNFSAGAYSDSQEFRYYFEDWVKHVYVGADWSSKQEIFNIDNLNIGSSPSEYIDNISDTGYVDINTLIGQIADEVVNLRTVVEESVLVKDNDSAIPYADSLQVAIDKYINQPESGVVIPSDIFGGLTSANGPVSYLWFMTKPLVSYTGDLLGLLTLAGDGTFQFTGLGYIVIGVVTIGIIGGLVTKCLL